MTYIPNSSTSTGVFSAALSHEVSGATNSGTIAALSSKTLTPETGLSVYTCHTFLVSSDREGRFEVQFFDNGGVLFRSKIVNLTNSGSEYTAIQTFASLTGRLGVKLYNDHATLAATFKVEARHYKGKTRGLSSNIDHKISNETECANVRSVIVGTNPVGEFNNVSIDEKNDLKVGINKPLAVFGDVLTAQLKPVINHTFAGNYIHPQFWDTRINGTGTVGVSSSLVELKTGGTASTASAVLESKQHVKYYGGIGVMGRFTAILEPVANNVQVIGVGHETSDAANFPPDTKTLDGYFFGTQNTTVGIYRGYSDTNTATFIPQSSWNLDRADGTGVLPVIDFTKGNVFEIQFQYLGFGAIKYSIEDPMTGDFIDVHVIEYSNSATLTSVKNPSFPFFAANSNSGTTTASTIKCASCGVFYQGIPPKPSLQLAINSLNVSVTSEVLLMGIKNKSTFQSENNENSVYLQSISVANGADTKNVVAAVIKIYKNFQGDTTWEGVGNTPFTPSYRDVSTAHSAVEYTDEAYIVATDAEAAPFDTPVGLDIPLFQTVVARDANVFVNLEPYKILLHKNEEIVVTGQAVDNTTEIPITVTISYTEEY